MLMKSTVFGSIIKFQVLDGVDIYVSRGLLFGLIFRASGVDLYTRK